MDLWAGASGDLWISAWGGGLNRMSFAAPGGFDRYRHDPYFPDSLSGDEAWTLLQDRSGMLWIGTAHSGLNQLPANTGQFQLYRHAPDNPDSVSEDAIGAFAEDSGGHIWLGTWSSGIDRFDPRTGLFDHFVANPDDANSLSSNLVMSLYADPQDNIWAGTLGGGLNRFDPATRRFKRYQRDALDPQSLIGDNLTSILPDGAAGLWLATLDGLDWLDLKSETFTHYQNDPADPQSLSFNQATSLYRDRDNQLWVGTWGGGLNRLDLGDPGSRDPQQARFTIYHHDPDNPASISSDAIWAIHQSPDGTLWFGTQGGLNRFDPQTQQFRAYREKQGLPNDTVLGILEDDAGHLWITTNNGLAKFDPRAELFTVYTSADGLQSNEFNSNAYFRSRDGTMYVGGVHGFNLFRPEDVKPNPVPPPVAVTRFAVFNQPQAVDLSGQTPIQLSYQQDFISFDFAALDFNAPHKNRYAYQLEGFDEEWIDAGTRPYASYTNLPGGSYIFRVKASNGDGVWNTAGVSLPIEITPPVWETWWFRMLGIAALIVGLIAAFRLRTRSIRHQKAALEWQVELRTAELQREIEQREKAEKALAESAAATAVASERTRLARDLHDAVTQTLFSASLIAEVLSDVWDRNQGEGRKRLEELRQLTRGALAEMRTLLVELRPNALIDVPLPVLLKQLGESFIGRARLPVQLNVDGSRTLPPDVQLAFYRITQEALNNIAKHAKATQVIVTLRMDGIVRLSIVDNGAGFDPAAVPADHLGTKIMRERAEAIGATYSLYSEPGEGTQISVTWEEKSPPAS
jgi:signal transduction histidine kinase/streptogramin lyase